MSMGYLSKPAKQHHFETKKEQCTTRCMEDDFFSLHIQPIDCFPYWRWRWLLERANCS
jgi:hypothetical protein